MLSVVYVVDHIMLSVSNKSFMLSVFKLSVSIHTVMAPDYADKACRGQAKEY